MSAKPIKLKPSISRSFKQKAGNDEDIPLPTAREAQRDKSRIDKDGNILRPPQEVEEWLQKEKSNFTEKISLNTMSLPSNYGVQKKIEEQERLRSEQKLKEMEEKRLQMEKAVRESSKKDIVLKEDVENTTLFVKKRNIPATTTSLQSVVSLRDQPMINDASKQKSSVKKIEMSPVELDVISYFKKRYERIPSDSESAEYKKTLYIRDRLGRGVLYIDSISSLCYFNEKDECIGIFEPSPRVNRVSKDDYTRNTISTINIEREAIHITNTALNITPTSFVSITNDKDEELHLFTASIKQKIALSTKFKASSEVPSNVSIFAYNKHTGLISLNANVLYVGDYILLDREYLTPEFTIRGSPVVDVNMNVFGTVVGFLGSFVVATTIKYTKLNGVLLDIQEEPESEENIDLLSPDIRRNESSTHIRGDSDDDDLNNHESLPIGNDIDNELHTLTMNDIPDVNNDDL